MLALPRNIILVGFMASGKSVVGEVLSRLTGMPLHDTDDEILLRAGKSIDQIFQESGEAAFRELERSVIDNMCSRSGNVIAAGGGGFVDPANRTLMLASGLVFCLSARPETILKRISEPQMTGNVEGEGPPFNPPFPRRERREPPPLGRGDRGGSHSATSTGADNSVIDQPVRPLLAGDDPMGRIKALLARRANAYAQAHHSIETDQLTPAQVAGRILELWSPRTGVNGE